MSIEKLQNAITILENIDPADELAYEKAFFAFNSISFLPIAFLKMEAGIHVFRARTHFDDEYFQRSSEISIPDKSLIRSFARCNRPFQSVFYCAENRPTSYMELVEYWASTSTEGSRLYVTIGQWITNTPLNLLIITSPDPDERVSDYDKYHGTAIDNFIEQTPEDKRELTIEFYRYMFSKFRKPAKDDFKTYIITTAYINLAKIHVGDDLAGVYYPSVPYRGNGVNFAFSPRIIENNGLTLVSALKSSFVTKVQDNGKLEFIEEANMEATRIENGNIDWSI
jgi:hypothetical protein